MLKTNYLLALLLFFYSTIALCAEQLGFECSEHLASGEKLKLYFNSSDSGQANYLLSLQNGLKLTYAQILSLAGDFYAVPEQLISEGQNNSDFNRRFFDAYKTLAENPSSLTEAPKIYAVMQSEYHTVLDRMQTGEKPEDIYKSISDNNNRQWNCITGGGCGAYWWLSAGRYLKLTENNTDHFGENALLVYNIGHNLAINIALAAHQSNNIQQLETAYAINAFASHFLSDYFSSGHMRTPRASLQHSVTPNVLGSILAAYMHVEDSQHGLHVYNQQGQHWMAFGDRYYFDPRNAMNRSILEKALQVSVNEIFYAFQQGIPPSQYLVYQLIPHKDAHSTQQDTAALFYWDNKNQTMFRREDITNYFDNHWIADWWGWTTLVLLNKHRGVPIDAQRLLATSDYRKQAIQYGLISDEISLRAPRKYKYL